MTFSQIKLADGPSPASKLHRDYCRVSPKNFSSVQDWKQVLAAGVSFEQAESIIRWLSHGGLPEFPAARTVARNAKYYAELASRDPMAMITQVSIEAFDLAVRIADTGYDIEPEYVQDAMRRYRAYLETVQEDGLLYAHMPPTRIFVEQWFTEIMAKGTPRMRRFHLEHTKFKEFVKLTARAARRG